VLCFDTETTSLDPETAKLRVIGVRSNKSEKVHVLWKKDFHKFKKWALQADIVISFNGDKYDIPVLCNDYNKMFKYQDSLTHEKGKGIDLWKVVDLREATFKPKTEDGKFENFKLDGICAALGLERKVQDFDYSLLQKEEEDLTPEEKALIEEYLIQDVNITYQLYEKMEELFQPLAQFLPANDVRRKNYIKSSMGAVTYKVICHIAGLKPQYRNVEESEGYKGADVLGPYKEFLRGVIECVDFASAYPHAYMHANLYTRCAFKYDDVECPLGNPCSDCKYKFTGGTTPDGRTLELFGTYCTYGGMGLLEKAIKGLFLMRKDAKGKMKKLKAQGKKDSMEYKQLDNYQQALKIVINTIYGISGSEKFVHTYNADTAADCTKICRFNLNYMHAKMAEFGYTVLYGDTDSAYVEDPFDDRERIEGHLAEIEANIKSIFPFPQETFKIELEDPIEYIQFFKDRTQAGRYKKKMYVMLLKDGNIKAKGITVIKRDASGLAKLIWKRYVKDHIKEHKNCDIPKKQIDAWIQDLIDEDIRNAAIQMNVKPVSEYANPYSLRAQISEKYGEGKHPMIKTTRNMGVGKGVKYVHADDAAEFEITDIDLTRVYSDLKDMTLDAQDSFERFL
jgi:DNA polymerase elongation subunit (family B)